MIARPNNWNEVKEFSERRKLDINAAVAKVKQAVVKSTDYGDQLCILFDIAEGDYAGFYKEDFDRQMPKPGEEKKWKGLLRLFLPTNDGSEKDEWTKSTLKGMATAFEKSNPGYQWNWDEKSLAGKLIGILFRDEEWEWNGKAGWAKRPFRAISVESVREGSFTVPNKKALNRETNIGYTAGYSEPNTFATVDDPDEELPF